MDRLLPASATTGADQTVGAAEQSASLAAAAAAAVGPSHAAGAVAAHAAAQGEEAGDSPAPEPAAAGVDTDGGESDACDLLQQMADAAADEAAAAALQEQQQAAARSRPAKLAPGRRGSGSSRAAVKKSRTKRTGPCSICHATETPQWRRGPDGRSLCNPCGMKCARELRKLLGGRSINRLEAEMSDCEDLDATASAAAATAYALTAAAAAAPRTPAQRRSSKARGPAAAAAAVAAAAAAAAHAAEVAWYGGIDAQVAAAGYVGGDYSAYYSADAAAGMWAEYYGEQAVPASAPTTAPRARAQKRSIRSATAGPSNDASSSGGGATDPASTAHTASAFAFATAAGAGYSDGRGAAGEHDWQPPAAKRQRRQRAVQEYQHHHHQQASSDDQSEASHAVADISDEEVALLQDFAVTCGQAGSTSTGAANDAHDECTHDSEPPQQASDAAGRQRSVSLDAAAGLVTAASAAGCVADSAAVAAAEARAAAEAAAATAAGRTSSPPAGQAGALQALQALLACGTGPDSAPAVPSAAEAVSNAVTLIKALGLVFGMQPEEAGQLLQTCLAAHTSPQPQQQSDGSSTPEQQLEGGSSRGPSASAASPSSSGNTATTGQVLPPAPLGSSLQDLAAASSPLLNNSSGRPGLQAGQSAVLQMLAGC